MEEFILYIWVPTKGWKEVNRFLTKDLAVMTAKEFLPLEVKVVRPAGTPLYGGRLCLPMFNNPEFNTLDK